MSAVAESNSESAEPGGWSYCFGPYRLDPFKLVLTREGEYVSATPQTLRVIASLVKGGGSLVEKATIFSEAWPHAIVSDGDLTQHIFTARRLLGDTYRNPKYIGTVERRGYRFLAPVTVVTHEGD